MGFARRKHHVHLYGFISHKPSRRPSQSILSIAEEGLIHRTGWLEADILEFPVSVFWRLTRLLTKKFKPSNKMSSCWAILAATNACRGVAPAESLRDVAPYACPRGRISPDDFDTNHNRLIDRVGTAVCFCLPMTSEGIDQSFPKAA